MPTQVGVRYTETYPHTMQHLDKPRLVAKVHLVDAVSKQSVEAAAGTVSGIDSFGYVESLREVKLYSLVIGAGPKFCDNVVRNFLTVLNFEEENAASTSTAQVVALPGVQPKSGKRGKSHKGTTRDARHNHLMSKARRR